MGIQLERRCASWLLDRLESYFDFDGRMNDEGKPTARLAIGVDHRRQAGRHRPAGPRLPPGRRAVPRRPRVRRDAAGGRTGRGRERPAAAGPPLQALGPAQARGVGEDLGAPAAGGRDRRPDEAPQGPCRPPDASWPPQALKKKQVGTIPVPPKYTSADFLKGDYWRLRGKLDVPKERWVSFPHCEGEDGTLVVAWAGYDHLQLARAISAYYVDVQERLGGRDDPRLVPLLACLIELLPWLKQWHNEVDPEFGVPMGDYFEGFIQEEARQLGKTVSEIRAWEIPQRTARRPRTSGAGTARRLVGVRRLMILRRNKAPRFAERRKLGGAARGSLEENHLNYTGNKQLGLIRRPIGPGDWFMADRVLFIAGCPDDLIRGATVPQEMIADLLEISRIPPRVIEQVGTAVEGARGFLDDARLEALVREAIPEKTSRRRRCRCLAQPRASSAEQTLNALEEWRRADACHVEQFPDEALASIRVALPRLIRPSAALEQEKKTTLKSAEPEYVDPESTMRMRSSRLYSATIWSMSSVGS